MTKGAVLKLSKLFKRLTTGQSSNCVTVLAPAVNFSSLLAISFRVANTICRVIFLEPLSNKQKATGNLTVLLRLKVCVRHKNSRTYFPWFLLLNGRIWCRIIFFTKLVLIRCFQILLLFDILLTLSIRVFRHRIQTIQSLMHHNYSKILST